MDKAKIFPVIFIIIMLAAAVVCWHFWTENEKLTESNQRLQQMTRELQDEKAELEQRHRRAAEENRVLSQRMDSIRDQLANIERERDSLRDRYQRVVEERDRLTEQLSERPQPQQVRRTTPSPEHRDDDYWSDFIQEKAKLEVELEQFEQRMLDLQSEMAQLRKENRELSLNMDELKKERERLEQDLRTRERAFRIASMDLVAERQKRGEAVDEVHKLRRETTDLKRELVVTNERKSRVQTRLKDVLDERNTLQQKMVEAESILKEKSLTLGDLQTGLSRTLKEGRQVSAFDPGSVELPPIVVRPQTPGLRGLRGEVIAVNPHERFVVLDLGEDSGVRPGALLRVMRGEREIATVEVIETRQSISAADIKEVVGGFNISEGDIVIAR